MARLTPEQAIARLQPSKAKAKGQQPTLKLLSVVNDNIYIVGNEDGGILTPAYDNIQPIIGTWEENGGEMPPSLQDWLQEYASEIEWYNRVGESLQQPEGPGLVTHAPKAPRQSIPVMLETKWSQRSPYNDTIIFDGKKCVTGCMTTAVGQLIFLWGQRGYYRGCEATDAYVTSTNGYEVDALPPLTVYDYPNLVVKPKTDKQKAAVQQLMTYVGRAFHSNYTPNSTGATPLYVAGYLRDKLRMGNGITYITAAKLGETSFESRIYNDLLQGKPVIVSAWTVKNAGHAFIIDGYDAEQDLYHVNWGWGGSYNGWFKISALNATSSYAFNSNKVAIIGIQPDYILGDINGDGEVDITDAMQVVQDVSHGTTKEREDINNDGQVTVTDAMLILDKILGRTDL